MKRTLKASLVVSLLVLAGAAQAHQLSITQQTTWEPIMQLTIESFEKAAAATTRDEYLGRLYFAGVAAILAVTLAILG